MSLREATPEEIQKMLDWACEAEEKFELDELESFTEHLRKKLELKKLQEQQKCPH